MRMPNASAYRLSVCPPPLVLMRSTTDVLRLLVCSCQVMNELPLEFLARARDKLRYRYPGRCVWR